MYVLSVYLINITMHFKQCSSHAQQKDGYGSLNSFGHDEDEYGDGGDDVVVVVVAVFVERNLRMLQKSKGRDSCAVRA